MSYTPQIDRANYTRMLLSLKDYNRVGGLLKMTKEQLENMPKEVMISLAPMEIARVWDKLPNHLKNDSDMLKYQFCYEHNKTNNDDDDDEADGPPPRRIFCCYCKVSRVNVAVEKHIKEKTSEGDNNNKKIDDLLNYLRCCCCCCRCIISE